MRMWIGVSPSEMCRKHLLGEHVELHMMVGSIRKGKSLAGFFRNRLIFPESIEARHDLISEEMINRGYQHRSVLPDYDYSNLSYPWPSRKDFKSNRIELATRCADCLIKMFLKGQEV